MMLRARIIELVHLVDAHVLNKLITEKSQNIFSLIAEHCCKYFKQTRINYKKNSITFFSEAEFIDFFNALYKTKVNIL